MSQTSYSLYHGKGYSGQLADISPREVETKTNEESTAGAMKFGLGVTYGSDDNSVLLPTADTDPIIGFVILTHNFELAIGGSSLDIPENATLDILRDGSIYVISETDVAQGDQVFVRHTVATTEQLGQVRNDLDTDKAVAVDWEFCETVTAGNVVKIRKR